MCAAFCAMGNRALLNYYAGGHMFSLGFLSTRAARQRLRAAFRLPGLDVDDLSDSDQQ